MTQSNSPCFLAFDLGAESGRAVTGWIDGQGMLQLQEVHRFNNGPVRLIDSLYWDVLHIWYEIQVGIEKAAHQYPGQLNSVGLDTWGVDFGLLAKDDTLLGNPVHYRDNRTEGMMEKAFMRVPRAEIYQTTGIQFLQLNTLYQVLSMVEAHSPQLEMADSLLMMPDLLNFWMCGRKVTEFTNATTSQCYRADNGGWADDMLKRLGIPTTIWKEVVRPGTVLGTLRPILAEQSGAGRLQVIAPATHDTGSAVAAIPADGSDHIYISSGTWSLMGMEIEKPIVTADSLAAEFTNEGGVAGTYRFLKNITGLWLVQECRRHWEKEGTHYSYDDLTRLAEAAPAFGSLVVASDKRFLSPGDMPSRLQAYCRQTGQTPPETPGALIRCALESLALEYRMVAESLDRMVGHKIPVIHIIGGGSRNVLLNQFAADATGKTVIAGPTEATAIGNLIVQAAATGQIASISEGRAIVRKSFNVGTYEPGNQPSWEDAYQRYLKLKHIE
jgi:rhamnulokinase